MPTSPLARACGAGLWHAVASWRHLLIPGPPAMHEAAGQPAAGRWKPPGNMRCAYGKQRAIIEAPLVR